MVIWLADRFPGYFRDLHKFQALPFNCAIAGAGYALLVVLAVVFFATGAFWAGTAAAAILVIAAGLVLRCKGSSAGR